jgi:hypothetical protein
MMLARFLLGIFDLTLVTTAAFTKEDASCYCFCNSYCYVSTMFLLLSAAMYVRISDSETDI